MKIVIDRNSAIPLHQQLRGAIEHEISFGGKAAGDSLPPVRELAEQTGVAPVTISKVYAELKAAGRIATRSGSGTFVIESTLTRIAGRNEMARLTRQIDSAIDLALAAGCAPGDVPQVIAARVMHRLGTRTRGTVIMLGLFENATASYARCIEHQVGHLATVEPLTLDQINSDEKLQDRVRRADLVLTFGTLEEEIERLLPDLPVLSLQFIPSEATRMAMAAIDPMWRVGIVSRFADFLPILTLGVRRFAPHLQSVTAHALDDPALPTALAACDVLVLSTGANTAADHVRHDTLTIEYRHIPDPGDIDRRVLPRLAALDVATDSNIKEAS